MLNKETVGRVGWQDSTPLAGLYIALCCLSVQAFLSSWQRNRHGCQNGWGKREIFFLNITLTSEGHRIILRRFCPKGAWSLWGFLPVLPSTTHSAEGAAHCTNGAALWVTQLQNLSDSVTTSSVSSQTLNPNTSWGFYAVDDDTFWKQASFLWTSEC